MFNYAELLRNLGLRFVSPKTFIADNVTTEELEKRVEGFLFMLSMGRKPPDGTPDVAARAKSDAAAEVARVDNVVKELNAMLTHANKLTVEQWIEEQWERARKAVSKESDHSDAPNETESPGQDQPPKGSASE